MTVISKVKQTLATLKSVQGTLDIYANQTKNNETKYVFQESAAIAGEIIRDIENRIQKIRV